MKKIHLNIIIIFIPGGCTGVWQFCDVGVQWIFKHSVKQLYCEKIVSEVLGQLEGGSKTITMASTVGIVQN
jgi:hypothetical protein